MWWPVVRAVVPALVHYRLCFGQEISGAAKSADGKANLPSSSTGIADVPPSANSYFTANGVQFYRPERFRTSRESYGARTSFGVNESAGEAGVGAGMVLPTAHRQGANVDGAETFGVLFGKELALVISRNGHDWPTVALNLGVARSGVDHKFRMLIPVYLAVHDGKIAHGRQHTAFWRRCGSKA